MAARRAERAEAQWPPLGDFVEIEGRKVHYVQAGEGPHLVLIHGASGNIRDWTFGFLDHLTHRYTVTVFDRPGLGYTDHHPELSGPFDTRAEGPEDQAALLKRAATELGVRDEIVVGHSFGGSVAMGWALNHDPAAVVALAGATQPWPGGLGALYTVNGTALGGAAVAPLIAAFASEPWVASKIERVFHPQPAPEGYADHIGVDLTLRTQSVRANARQITNLRPHVVSMSRRYPSLTLPIELVHGTEDAIVPIHVHSEPLSEQVDSAHLTRLDGIGHMPHHVATEEVTAAIERAARRAGI
ncbi:alpha/beta fold hydrolase [Palleronia caenipelagi]|nr:alpha/beta hydrolase [Palleronia caenipelagi]